MPGGVAVIMAICGMSEFSAGRTHKESPVPAWGVMGSKIGELEDNRFGISHRAQEEQFQTWEINFVGDPPRAAILGPD